MIVSLRHVLRVGSLLKPQLPRNGRLALASSLQRSQSEDKLVNWLDQKGMENYGVKIDHSSLSGRGLFSTRDFVEGDVIVRFPMHLAVMVYQQDSETNIEIEDPDLPDTVIRLAVKLLKLAKTDSLVGAYASSLPEEFPNPSIVFKSTAQDDIYRDMELDIVNYYERTAAFLIKQNIPKGVTERDIRWALAAIQSRSFGNGMGQEMLLPFIDIMNHGDFDTSELFPEHPLANVTYGWVQLQEKANRPENWRMVFQAKRTILEGEELFVSYGDHSNEFFLLHYGFVPLYNPRDEFVLFRNLDDILSWFFERFPEERGSLTHEQMEMLKKQIRIEGHMSEVVKLNICADGSVSPIMVEFFIFLCKGSREDAKEMIALVCQERLRDSTHILEDLRLLRDSVPDDNDFFEYLYRGMELKLKNNSVHSYPCLDTDQPEIVPAQCQRSAPVYQSLEWWCLLHGYLKKKILWDFMLCSSRL